ncbi:MAG: DUF4430 domain-containing protein [Candidatus Nomurabacteria bacterium]|jgi:hypothetical protein|nr:DUF4430 domain-containing protein [Candidatus Nomurabacteria bacterium]
MTKSKNGAATSEKPARAKTVKSKLRKSTVGLIVILAIVVVAAAILTVCLTRPAKKLAPTKTTAAAKVCPMDAQNVVSYDGESGKTAYQILADDCTVKSSDSSYGKFVTEINGVAAGTTKYWAFYINGKYASVGADKYQTKDGDQLKWQLEAIQK